MHFPFCRRRCVYCDFFSTCGGDLQDAYIKELNKEIRTFSQRAGEEIYVDTVYFGGGTPSTVSFSNLKSVAETLYANFDCRIKEFTVEVNPCSSGDIEKYRDFGVTRLSFGVQSLKNDVLKFLGRLHDKETAIKALELAKLSGYRVSADLMLGVPEETADDVADFSKELSELAGHISAYILKVEEGTELARIIERGEVVMPSEEEVEAEYNAAVAALGSYGFKRYEISNFAREGEESLHNLKYWRGEEYLGFGASAHSYFSGRRYYNSPDIKAYINGAHAGCGKEISEDTTSLTPEEEYLMLKLRLNEGVSFREFSDKFGKSLIGCYGNKIEHLKDFLTLDGEILRIKSDKMLLQNAILTELFS